MKEPLSHLESLRAELRLYLSTADVDVDDPIAWWYAHTATFPNLWRMGVDYLSIPGT